MLAALDLFFDPGQQRYLTISKCKHDIFYETDARETYLEEQRPICHFYRSDNGFNRQALWDMLAKYGCPSKVCKDNTISP